MRKFLSRMKSLFRKSKDILYLVDYGHGGLNPQTLVYVTPGKRSPKDDDGNVLYEGVNNRIIGLEVLKRLSEAGVRVIDIVDDWKDIPLRTRGERARTWAEANKCVYISLHSNAVKKKIDPKTGKKEKWGRARGIGVYFHPDADDDSKEFAELVGGKLEASYKGITNWRGYKLRNFAVLRYALGKKERGITRHGHPYSSILIECGFHDNEKEVKTMRTKDWREREVCAIVDSCKEFNIK